MKRYFQLILAVLIVVALLGLQRDHAEAKSSEYVKGPNVALLSLGVETAAARSDQLSPPNNLIDENDSTYWWGGDLYPVSANWVIVNLQTPKTITAWRLRQYPSNSAHYASQYGVLISNDCYNWTPVATHNVSSSDETISFSTPVTSSCWLFDANSGGAGAWAIYTIELYDDVAPLVTMAKPAVQIEDEFSDLIEQALQDTADAGNLDWDYSTYGIAGVHETETGLSFTVAGLNNGTNLEDWTMQEDAAFFTTVSVTPSGTGSYTVDVQDDGDSASRNPVIVDRYPDPAWWEVWYGEFTVSGGSSLYFEEDEPCGPGNLVVAEKAIVPVAYGKSTNPTANAWYDILDTGTNYLRRSTLLSMGDGKVKNGQIYVNYWEQYTDDYPAINVFKADATEQHFNGQFDESESLGGRTYVYFRMTTPIVEGSSYGQIGVNGYRLLCHGAMPNPTPTPTAKDPSSGGNYGVLGDTGMEQYPVSSYWFPTNYDVNTYTVGRLNTNNLITRLAFGDARCGSGMQLVGKITSAVSYWWTDKRIYSNMKQSFHWNGGKLYYRYSVKGRSGYPEGLVPMEITIKTSSSGTILLKISENIPVETWLDRSGSVAYLPPGDYIFTYGTPEQQDVFYNVFYDDIVVDYVPASGPCEALDPRQVTATPAPISTGTEPIGKDLLQNCGFNQGSEGWSVGAELEDAYIVYEYDAVEAKYVNYAFVGSSARDPAFWQVFRWPGGTAYIYIRATTNHRVYLTNWATGSEYPVSDSSNMYGVYGTEYEKVFLPEGVYKINLHIPIGHGPSKYDAVTVSQYNFDTCWQSSGGATPTVMPTATPNYTRTAMATPTMQPTKTQSPAEKTAGAPTYTPFPTYTPYPTFTPQTPPASTPTPRPTSTRTPYPTYTPQPTLTPYPTYTMVPTNTMSPAEQTAGAPTYTPYPTYTPAPGNPYGGLPTQPPPPQPPPSYYADCNRPQNGLDIAWWIEYSRCTVLSYFEFGPRPVATIAAVPTLFAGSEPMGTFSELQATNKQVEALINAYDWENTGLPGVKDPVDVGQFTSPAAADSPWNGGKIDLNPDVPSYSRVCQSELIDVVGSLLAGPMCFIFNILHELALMPWLQLFINLGVIFALGVYIWEQWIDRGTG